MAWVPWKCRVARVAGDCSDCAPINLLAMLCNACGSSGEPKTTTDVGIDTIGKKLVSAVDLTQLPSRPVLSHTLCSRSEVYFL
jgi:hypothetical protein